LRAQADDIVTAAYEKGKLLAANETGFDEHSFPEHWSLDPRTGARPGLLARSLLTKRGFEIPVPSTNRGAQPIRKPIMTDAAFADIVRVSYATFATRQVLERFGA